MKAERFALYVVPGISVLTTALVLIGPGAPRASVGARVYGVVGSSRTLALRIEGVRRLHGIDDAATEREVTVDARPEKGAPLTTSARLGSDGIVEARLESPTELGAFFDLRVTSAGVPLAGGRVRLGTRSKTRAPMDSTVDGTTSGALVPRVTIPRSFLAAPFPEELRVELPSAVRYPITVELTCEGGALDATKATLEAAGKSAVFHLSARSHTVELSVQANDRFGSAGRWEGSMPVVPGAMWIDPAPSDTIAIRAPVPRDRAYVSVHDARGRVFGAVVPLSPDTSGVWSGAVPLRGLPALDSATELTAVVASDPWEQGSGTVAWPIRGQLSARPETIELLLDGMASADANEAERARGARRVAFAVIALAAVAEVLLFLRAELLDRRRLLAGLARFDADDTPENQADHARLLTPSAAQRALGIAIFTAIVGLAFTLLAAVTTFR
jgi:hypothetical protein